MILYELINGHVPFQSTNKTNLIQKVNKGVYSFKENFSIWGTVELVSFLNICLQNEENNRASIEELVNHPFVNKTYEEQKKLKPTDLETLFLSSNSESIIQMSTTDRKMASNVKMTLKNLIEARLMKSYKGSMAGSRKLSKGSSGKGKSGDIENMVFSPG